MCVFTHMLNVLFHSAVTEALTSALHTTRQANALPIAITPALEGFNKLSDHFVFSPHT